MRTDSWGRGGRGDCLVRTLRGYSFGLRLSLFLPAVLRVEGRIGAAGSDVRRRQVQRKRVWYRSSSRHQNRVLGEEAVKGWAPLLLLLTLLSRSLLKGITSGISGASGGGARGLTVGGGIGGGALSLGNRVHVNVRRSRPRPHHHSATTPL